MAKKARVWDGSQWIDLASAVTDLTQYANLTTTPISGFRNKIINGGFDINQRAGSPYTIPAAYGSFPYTLDRWQAYRGGTGGTYTVSATATTPGELPGNEPKQFLRYQCTSAQTGTADVQLRQAIEDVRSVANGTFTLSFWAKAASNTSIGVFYEQNFGTGGSTAVVSSVTTINLTTSWAKYSVTWTPASLAGKTISSTDSKFYVYFAPPALTTFTFDIWGVQLEQGTIATPFEQRPIGTELSLCQRYYYQISNPNNVTNARWSSGVQNTTTASELLFYLPVSMRVLPAVTYAGGVSITDAFSFTQAITSVATAAAITNPVLLQVGHSAVGASRYPIFGVFTNNTGFVYFSAEL